MSCCSATASMAPGQFAPDSVDPSHTASSIGHLDHTLMYFQHGCGSKPGYLLTCLQGRSLHSGLVGLQVLTHPHFSGPATLGSMLRVRSIEAQERIATPGEAIDFMLLLLPMLLGCLKALPVSNKYVHGRLMPCLLPKGSIHRKDIATVFFMNLVKDSVINDGCD